MRREVALWFVALVLVAVEVEVPWMKLGAEGATLGLEKSGKLQWHYYRYQNNCRDVDEFVKSQVEFYWKGDTTIVPKLLRMLYSDCFVTGCDASVMLDGPNTEKAAAQNAGLGGFALIDKIKTVLEQRCPGVVSCADILNLATRAALHLAGAPSYPVFTGRRDGLTSTASSVDLPSPSISWEAALAYFKSRGLNEMDLVTLLSGHSLGGTHCRYMTDRLYNFNNTRKPDPNMDPTFVKAMQKLCPQKVNRGQPDPVVPLNSDSGMTYSFTNSYYTRIQNKKGVLGVDQQLVLANNNTKQIVAEFAAGFEDLRREFAKSMTRMGSIGVLTGTQGEIRRNCHFTNANNPN